MSPTYCRQYWGLKKWKDVWSSFSLLITSQERYPLQRQHVFVVIRHLVVELQPHVDKLVTVYQADKLARAGASSLCIGREGAAGDEQGYITSAEYT